MWTLARKLLFHDRLRFAVAIAGVCVSVMLVLVQVGLYFGFMDTASSLIDASRADIWVGKKSNDSFEFATPFDERTLLQGRVGPGRRAQAERVLINFAQFKLADGGDLGVQVVGVETTPGRHAAARAVERRRRATRSRLARARARSSSTRASTPKLDDRPRRPPRPRSPACAPRSSR